MTADRGRRVPRRRFLGAVGSGAFLAGLAGCTDAETVRRAAEGAASALETTETPSGSTATPAGAETASRTETAGETETDAADDADPGVEGTDVAFGDCGGTVGTACADPVELVKNVTEDTTLGGDCDRYLVTKNLEVRDGARLTVEAGTEVRFVPGAGLSVIDDAELVAVGTCAEPVLFAGEQHTRGYWDGIYFQNATSTANRLAYCVVEDGGGDEFWKADVPANLAVTSGSRVKVDHCALRGSAGYGFTFTDDVHVDSFEANIATENADGAGYVRDASAHLVSGSGAYTGNDEDVVAVRKHDHVAADADVTWDALDVPYRVVDGEMEVYGALTVDPGTTVEFAQNGGLKVFDDGSLTAVGIEPSTERLMPITFTGVQKTRGYWHGIYFHDTDRTANQLRHCVVEYGGGDEFWQADVPANVAVARGSRLRVDNCTLRESAGHGFTFTGDVTVDSFIGNTVTRNADGAGFVHDSTVHFLSDISTYTGNDRDRVAVWAHSHVPADAEVSWEALDVPYYVHDGAAELYGHVTIEPGATLEFGQNASIKVFDTGSLTAVGMVSDTEEVKPITFTGSQKTRGYWQGIYFHDTDSTENLLQYCVVEYGGSKDFWMADVPADVAAAHGSRLRVYDCALRESAGYGLFASADSTVDRFRNDVTLNATGDVLTG